MGLKCDALFVKTARSKAAYVGYYFYFADENDHTWTDGF